MCRLPYERPDAQGKDVPGKRFFPFLAGYIEIANQKACEKECKIVADEISEVGCTVKGIAEKSDREHCHQNDCATHSRIRD